MEIVTGRPLDCERRLEKEVRVYDFLDALHISYQRIDHLKIESMNECAKIAELLDAVICKNLFLWNAAKDQFYLLMLVGNKKFRSGEVAGQIGSTRLSFAPETYMKAYLDILPGAVSVMGLMNDKDNAVHLLVDADVLSQEYLGCHPCVNTSSLRLKTADVFETFLNAVHHDYSVVHLGEKEEK